MAFIYVASNAQTITVLRSLGVLENSMEHHAQALLGLSISSALPRGLDLGTPPIEPPSGEHR